MNHLKTFSFICVATLLTAANASAVTVSLQAGVGGQSAQIIQEAMLVQSAGNDNFGGRTDFEVGVLGAGEVRTTVMRFDVTDPSLGLYSGGVAQFASVESVVLTLTTTSVSTSPTTMKIRVAAGQDAQGDWVEGTGTTATSVGDAGTVTYTERREGAATGWSPDTNYTRNGDNVLGSVIAYPGINTTFDIVLAPLAGETLADLLNRWATGNNEGILINDFDRTGNARWIMHSSESATLALRPKLTITFTTIPEPSTALVLSLAGAALLRRRCVRA